jgi:hypothetical protein
VHEDVGEAGGSPRETDGVDAGFDWGFIVRTTVVTTTTTKINPVMM